MARVTASEVREILKDINSDLADLDPFINVANRLVTAKLSDSGLSTDQLKDVELFLSAHLVTVADPKELHQKVGDATSIYEGSFGEGLRSSRYGQTAITIDTTGTLANAGKRKAKVEAIPTS